MLICHLPPCVRESSFLFRIERSKLTERKHRSVWVKIGAATLGGALYAWTIIAPIAFPNREF